MCYGAEALWIPAVIAAAGGATTAVTADQARKKQDREAARGIMEQSSLQRKAGEKVSENIQSIQNSNPEAEKRAAESDFMTALKNRQNSGAPDALQPLGGGSQRYAEDVGAAKTQGATDTASLVKNLAAIDAPGYQRIREGQTTADTASKLGLIDQQSQGQDFLTKLRVGSITPNPWMSALGSGLSAYGQASAGNAGKVKTPRVVGTTPSIGTGPL